MRSDNGTEYCNNAFTKCLREFGIIHQKSVPYNPEQNGMAERVNRTLTEKARCMLIDSKLPKRFWAEAVNNAVYVANRSPHKSLKLTPEEMWNGRKPDVSHMRVFGCAAMFFVPKQKRLKWDAKSEHGIFLGYGINCKGYRVYDVKKNKYLRIEMFSSTRM